MEQFERIRRDARDEGMSIRALADKHRVHRRTVRQALADATPPTRKTPVREAPVLGRYETTIRRWLVEDLDAPRKLNRPEFDAHLLSWEGDPYAECLSSRGAGEGRAPGPRTP